MVAVHRPLVPPLVNVLTVVVGSHDMTYVIKLMKEEKRKKACWKIGKNLLVRANVVLLNKALPLAPNCWCEMFALSPTDTSHALVKSRNPEIILMEGGIPYTFG